MPSFQPGHAPGITVCPPQPFLLVLCRQRPCDVISPRGPAVSMVLLLGIYSLWCDENSGIVVTWQTEGSVPTRLLISQPWDPEQITPE